MQTSIAIPFPEHALLPVIDRHPLLLVEAPKAATEADEPNLPDMSIEQLADFVNQHHNQARGYELHAYLAGQALAEIKSRLPHGEWEPWLEKNFHGSARTARRYM